MAKPKTEPETTSESSSPIALTKHLDPMIRAQVQGVMLADASLTLEQAVRKVDQAIAAGIIAKSDTREGVGRREATTLPPGTKVIVRRCQGGEFTYGGRTMDRNQVFELTGLRNDDGLVRLGYVEALHPDVRLETCGTCGAQFADASSAAAHHTRRHEPRVERRPVMEPRRPGELPEEYEQREAAWRAAIIADEDAADARDEQAENVRAPLYLDQTKASRA